MSLNVFTMPERTFLIVKLCYYGILVSLFSFCSASVYFWKNELLCFVISEDFLS